VQPLLEPIVDAALERRAARGEIGTVAIGVTGGVAVGKSFIATELAAGVRERGVEAVNVTTDNLLLSNAELQVAGLTMRKGFPESYDDTRVDQLAMAIWSGAPTVELPVYSHETYDLVPGSLAPVPLAPVVVIEGLIALQPPLAEALDVAVYVDADEADIFAWFAARLAQLIDEARSDPTSFYAGFVGLGPDLVRDFARNVWEQVNAPNLRDHIAPTRLRADWIVHKASDHSFALIDQRKVDRG
jgi:type I pantothenate kinase